MNSHIAVRTSDLEITPLCRDDYRENTTKPCRQDARFYNVKTGCVVVFLRLCYKRLKFVDCLCSVLCIKVDIFDREQLVKVFNCTVVFFRPNLLLMFIIKLGMYSVNAFIILSIVIFVCITGCCFNKEFFNYS